MSSEPRRAPRSTSSTGVIDADHVFSTLVMTQRTQYNVEFGFKELLSRAGYQTVNAVRAAVAYAVARGTNSASILVKRGVIPGRNSNAVTTPLRESGHIEKTAAISDARAIDLTLTPSGQILANTYGDLLGRLADKLTREGLTPRDLEQYAVTSSKIAAALQSLQMEARFAEHGPLPPDQFHRRP